MKILIAGYGFVGRAHYEVLKFKHDVVINDPALGYTNSYDDVDAVIVCVATPQKKDGSCHMDNVYNVVEQCPDVPILIKSTISIEGWQQLKQKYPNKGITFSPEFLRAKTAIEDFNKQEVMYFSNNDCNDDWEYWSKLFLNNNKSLKFKLASAEELILSKYFRNSFLATKVSFFNQMYDLCTELDVSFNEVRECVADDIRIGDSHSYVTDERGFGGHCFPKDTMAILSTANKNGIDLSLIKESIQYNNKIRV